jgi:hypothetical protein
VLAFLALTAIAKFSSDGCFLWVSIFVGDIVLKTRNERFDRHRTEVLVAPGSNSRCACNLFLVAHDQDVRQLLERVLSDFLRNFLVAEV